MSVDNAGALMPRAVAGLLCLAAVIAATLFLSARTIQARPRPAQEKAGGRPLGGNAAFAKAGPGRFNGAFVAALAASGIQFRWSGAVVPLWLTLLGETLVAGGLWVVFRVLRENTFASSYIKVEARQTLITTGPYAHVRPVWRCAIGWFRAYGDSSGIAGCRLGRQANPERSKARQVT